MIRSLLPALAAVLVAAEPQVQRTPEALRIDLGNGAVLTYPVVGGRLLGLGSAEIDGVALKSPSTVQAPLLAQEFGTDRMAWPGLRLEEAVVADGGVELRCALLGTTSPKAVPSLFVMAGEGGKNGIHRDYYRYAMTLQPETLIGLKTWTDLGSALELTEAGTLTWTVKPEMRTIAGWRWAGWRQSFSFALGNGRRVNNIRTLGTWELGGSAVGATAVSVRYRGLGRIEQAFTAGPDGGIKEAFTTTEILPGAVDGAPVISPAVPKSANVGDRGFAIKHRFGAWIGRPARGAGSDFVDFQFIPTAAFAAFPLRQGDLRALTEAFPGDHCISQTDEEWFANTDTHQTIPMVYLAQVAKTPQPANIWRTRWHEIDQHVRDAVSAELQFIQPTALPGVGALASNGTADYMAGLAKGAVDPWYDMGVRLVASHSPGWLRNSSSEKSLADAGMPVRIKAGGECSIYDFVPDADQRAPWKAFSTAMAKRGMVYYPWIGMTVVDGGPLTKRVGPEKEKWSLNTPDDKVGPGYEPIHIKGNIHNPVFRKAYLDTLAGTIRDYGLQGFWIDSFQNLFMSQLAWGDGSGAPMQRAYWEIISEWSRNGVALMAESHAFPGLSCSIEVQEWEKDVTYFRHVWKWHRGMSQNGIKPEELDRLCFRAAAVKGWTAPDKSYSGDAKFSIPSFKRIAHEYLAALPLMARPYLLADDAGVLWLSADSDGNGVVFSFREQPVPAGVTATGIADHAAASKAATQSTYKVAAKDLRAAFDVVAPPQTDERLGNTDAVKPFPYIFPAWAK